MDKVKDYLICDRGITEETARRFKLGYSDDDRLAIPYLTPAGPWYIKRRCIQPHNCKEHGCPKYIYDAGIEPRLFNAQTLIDADVAVIVEGELDAIACEQAGIPAVAYPGASSWGRKTRHWAWCFDSLDEVVVIADGDEPGVKAAGEVAASLRRTVHADVRVLEMPAGLDANSFIIEFGEPELLAELGWL